MLRILRDDGESGKVVLTLQGHLVAEWAEVLERECLESSPSGRGLVLDLSGVGFVGRAGIDVLGRLYRTGVAMVGCSSLLADMLEQEGIEVDRGEEER